MLKKIVAIVVLGLAVASASALATATGAAADATDPAAAYKASHDTDLHVPLSASDQALLASKERAAAAHAAGSSMQAIVPLSAVALAANQQPQQTSYWCGPATLAEKSGAKGRLDVTIFGGQLSEDDDQRDGLVWCQRKCPQPHRISDERRDELEAEVDLLRAEGAAILPQ